MAYAIGEGRKWEEGNLFVHPGEDVILKINRFVTGKAGRYAVAELSEPEAPVFIWSGKTKHFPLREIADPVLVYTCETVVLLQEIGFSKVIIPVIV